MLNQFSRTEIIFGKTAMEKIFNSRVAVFGIGGVGSYTVEALVRSGIGAVDIFDDDRICLTNINRQLFATRDTVGKYKVDVAEERLLAINPKVKITKHNIFFTKENANDFDFSEFDYIVDAIDTVTGKIALVEKANENKIPIISAMGAGNKIDPTKFEVTDIYKTEVCPLAKVMRYELKKRGIKKLKVVYSKEIPKRQKSSDTVCNEKNCICPKDTKRKCTVRRQIPGSNAFVPPVVGLIIAGEVIKDLTKNLV